MIVWTVLKSNIKNQTFFASVITVQYQMLSVLVRVSFCGGIIRVIHDKQKRIKSVLRQMTAQKLRKYFKILNTFCTEKTRNTRWRICHNRSNSTARKRYNGKITQNIFQYWNQSKKIGSMNHSAPSKYNSTIFGTDENLRATVWNCGDQIYLLYACFYLM